MIVAILSTLLHEGTFKNDTWVEFAWYCINTTSNSSHLGDTFLIYLNITDNKSAVWMRKGFFNFKTKIVVK